MEDPAVLTVALIAHDGKKDDMVALAKEFGVELSQFALIGTNTTATLVHRETGLAIEKLLSGPLGGDVQIAARVATGDVHAVIFLVDPLNAHPHDPDIQAIQRVCNVHNVPIATNTATAALLLRADTI